MATAAQASGEHSILEAVADFVDEAIILRVFGFGRDALRSLIERVVPAGIVEKAWEALLSDPQLVSVPPHLLAIATREEIAKDLAAVLARSPYYGATTKKATALAHRVTANTIVTRASYYQFEKTAMERVSRLMAETFATLDREAGRMVARVVERLSGSSPLVRERILKQIAERATPEAKDYFARMDSALTEWRDAFARTVIEDAKAGRRQGFQRAVDTMHHFEDARNPWSRLAHPLSSVEMGASLFTHRHQVLPIAERRVLIEARGLEASIRKGISRIVTKEVFLKGENPKRAAAEILRRYRAELGERWGGARTSALRIARTESSYILNEAARVAYEEMGVRFVDVIYTEGSYPCDICPPIADGGPYEISDVPEGGIPFHPNCRCCYAAAFPTKKSVEALTPPAKVFGAKTWATELAKYGFVATAASRLFGTERPSASEREAVKEVLDSVEEADDAEAQVIDREVAGGYYSVKGYRRIEPDRFPSPLRDQFREVTVRDPVRAIYDLRKNSYEIGGVIRGTRILYYRGDESSVSIPPVLVASGGVVSGDVMFHTHPTSLKGYMPGSMPSHADLLVHMRAASHQGDGARHIISGADGLREIRAEIKDIGRWRATLSERYFHVFFTLLEEVVRGSAWWSTYGIRRALKRLEDLDMGGRLVVSEPTTPGSDFIPLRPYVAATHVHPAVIADLERRTGLQLRTLYEQVAGEQDVALFRDRDYYIGVLRSLDPSRDWDEAAPTKNKALELLRSQGGGATGTHWSRDELIRHLSGQPVFGRTYIDTSKIDYQKLLGIAEGSALPPVPSNEEWDAGEMLSDEDIDRVFDHLARVHGIPVRRTYEVKVAALEQYDPNGSHLGQEETELDARLRKVDVSRPPDYQPELLASVPGAVREAMLKRLREQQDLDAWTIAQKRDIIAGRPVHGIVFLPDRTIVWWGGLVPDSKEAAPDISPVVSRLSKHGEWTGMDPYRSPLLYSNRQQVFKERWGITLREDAGTAPWTLAELTGLDYALHLVPGAARAFKSVSRHFRRRSAYLPSLERLVIGDSLLFDALVSILVRASIVKVMRAGYFDEDGYRVPGTRSTVFREWLSVEPWRYEVQKVGILHPATIKGERAVLAGVGRWVQPRGSRGEDPGDSLTYAITAYVVGAEQDEEHVRFVREHIFSGDTFVQEGKVRWMDSLAPVRVRRTKAVPLI